MKHFTMKIELISINHKGKRHLSLKVFFFPTLAIRSRLHSTAARRLAQNLSHKFCPFGSLATFFLPKSLQISKLAL